VQQTSKPSHPDNAEQVYKCKNCGNMATREDGKCNICGEALAKDNMLYASNEDY
jgi:rubrerythrin